MTPTRRDLLRETGAAATGSIAALAVGCDPARTTPHRNKNSRTQLITLGTKGGPQLSLDRYGPSQVLIVDERAYLIDCGEGVLFRLIESRVSLAELPNLFITHQHSDHNADLSSLLLLGWAHGRHSPIDIWGPPPMRDMIDAFFELNEYDIEIWIADEGRTPLRPLIKPHEVTSAGHVMRDDLVEVTAALVEHPQ